MKRLALALLVGAATCAPAHFYWDGPTYPPYGDATFNYSGEPGLAGGRLMTFSSLQTEYFHDLAYGIVPGSVYLSLTGNPPTESEKLLFEGMSGYYAVYSGQSDMWIVRSGQLNVLHLPVYLRWQVVDGGQFLWPDWIGLGGLTAEPVVQVTWSNFTVQIEALAIDEGMSTPEPYLTVYNRYQHPQGAQSHLELSLGFYQTFERQFSGTVDAGDYIGTSRSLSQIPFTLRLLDKMENEVWSKKVFLENLGSLSLMTTEPTKSGPCSLELSGGTWLKRKLQTSMTNMGCLDLQFDLVNGDIDQDNAITVFDYAVLSGYFDKNDTDADWTTVDPQGRMPRDADLDGDGAVTVFDYAILSNNFDKHGD